MSSTIPTPELQQLADTIGYPLVLKPPAESLGKGVFTNICEWEELRAAFDHLVNQHHASRIILEKHYRGADYRLLVIGDRVVAACKRIPANVTGDGNSTIAQLIEKKNRHRRKNPFLGKGLIQFDYEVEKSLEEQQLTVDSIPDRGRNVTLRKVANASAGGDVVDCTDTIPEEIKEAAVAALAAVPGLSIAGVDILYEEGPTPVENRFTVIEMNSRPHIGVNMYPSVGVGRDVPKAMLDYYFPRSKRPEVPNLAKSAFDHIGALAPVRSGIATAVELVPFPKSGFPAARVMTVAPISPTGNHQRRIRSLARRIQVSGFLRSNDEHTKIMAAGTATAVTEFLDAVLEVLDVQEVSTDKWEGKITQGFAFKQGKQAARTVATPKTQKPPEPQSNRPRWRERFAR